jgi:hypothetical protein
MVRVLPALGSLPSDLPILLLFLPLFIIIFTLLFFIYSLNKDKLNLPRISLSRRFGFYLLLISCLLIFNYIFLVGLYTFSNNYIDHAEANIAAISWLFQTGHPLYPKLDAAERYINNYGPALYIINGFILNLFNPSIFTSKISSALAVVISLVSISYALAKVSGTRTAIICSAYITLIFLSLNTYSTLLASTFWSRPDPLIFMCVSVGLLAVVRTPPPIAALLCALSLGISLNLKVFAIFYFLPVYALLYRRTGVYYTLISLLGFLVVAAAPFLYLPQVSFENYIMWLRKVSHQGLGPRQLIRNIGWIIYICIPIIVSFIHLFFTDKSKFNQFIQRNRIYINSIIVSVIAIVIIGSKPGSQENNLLPLIPSLTYFFIIALAMVKELTKERSTSENTAKYLYLIAASTSLAWLASALLIAIPNEAGFISKLISSPQAINDINTVVKSYPGKTIGMGYSKSYELSFYRPFLVFLGHPYLLDAASIMEMQQSRSEPIPPATLAALRSCQTKIWLIPKGEPPFQLSSYYPPSKQLFNDEFKTVFLDKYERREQTNYYDLWFCKDKNLAS